MFRNSAKANFSGRIKLNSFINYVVIAGVACLGVTGCDQSAPTTNSTPDEAEVLLSTPLELGGNAKIVVFRGAGIPWGLPALAKPDVKLDGVVVGSCSYRSNIEHIVSPGNYRLSEQTDIIARLDLNLLPNTVVYVSCGVLPIGLLLPAPSLTVVSQEVALRKMSEAPVEEPTEEVATTE